MNAAGLTFVMGGVYATLQMPFFQSIVTDGRVSQGEFTGTLQDFGDTTTTLRNTPGNEIEAMVDQFNDYLTEHLDKFNSEWGTDLLAAFREAQMMLGFVTTVMAKSGLSD